MRSRRNDFSVVRELGSALPGVEEGTTYGSPALKIGGRMFACIAINRAAEANTLAVRVGFDVRDELIATDPDVYYLADHYIDYPVVLVRLARVHREALRDLLRMAWKYTSSSRTTRKGPARTRTRRAGATRS